MTYGAYAVCTYIRHLHFKLNVNYVSNILHEAHNRKKINCYVYVRYRNT